MKTTDIEELSFLTVLKLSMGKATANKAISIVRISVSLILTELMLMLGDEDHVTSRFSR